MKVREIKIQDYSTVIGICHRNGLNLRMSNEKWIKFWKHNPYIAKNHDFPMGWLLLTDGGREVGSLMNVPIEYELNRKKLLAVVGSSWAVDIEYRKASILLIMKFFQQKNVDFFINSTANDASGPVFKAFKGRQVPCLSYDQVLFWVVDCVSFAKSALLKRQIPMADFLRYPIGSILWCINKFNGSFLSGNGNSVVRLYEFDDRFDSFWEKLRLKENRLLAKRDKVSLNWHFHVARSRDEIAIFAILNSDEIVGYLVLATENNRKINLKRFRIIDLQMLEEKSNIVKDLLSAALSFSANQGSSIVECIGFSGEKRSCFKKLSFYNRKLVPYPFYFKPGIGKDNTILDDPKIWDPCPYDGDTSLFS